MLKLWFVLFVLQPLISAAVADKTNKTITDIYSKFKQNDYNVTVEWMELVRYKEPELNHIIFTLFKYNRTCPALNVTLTATIAAGYELEVITQAYKFASNEYRFFPMRIQVNACKAIASNMVGLNKLMNCGNFTGCPFRKGTFHICNWTIDQSQFPPLIPTGRYMTEQQAVYRGKELWVTRHYIDISRSVVKK